MTRSALKISQPARDLALEYRRVSKSAEALKRKSSARHASEKNASPGSRESQRAGPGGVKLRTNTPPSQRTRNTVAQIEAVPVSPERSFWRDYTKRAVHERLRDLSHWESTMSALRDERRQVDSSQCPFEPALSIRTVMGTHARRSPAQGRNVALRRDPTASPSANAVRVVTIRAPNDLSDDERMVNRWNEANVGRADEPPHYMMPLPLSAPAAPPPPLQLTPRARRVRRGAQAREAWAEARLTRLKERESQLRQLTAEADLRACTPFRVDPMSEMIVRGMSDRRLDVFEQAKMDGLARAAAARGRMARLEAEREKDVKYQRIEQFAAKDTKPDLDWFMQLVRDGS